MPESHLRAADADRAAVADVLGAHMSAGRLSVAEYDERLARAYASRTYGELDQLTADLPAPVPAPATAAAAEPAAGGAHSAQPSPAWTHGMSACGSWAGGSSLRAAWASWLTTALIVIGIWAATSIASTDWIYPWPIWVIGPWGAVLLAQSVTGNRDRGRDRGRRLTTGG